MNPAEVIENDKRLTSILKGLSSLWNFSNEFLSIVLWHTDDYEKSNEVIEIYMSTEEMSLEEALSIVLTPEEYEDKCLNSKYLDLKRRRKYKK